MSMNVFCRYVYLNDALKRNTGATSEDDDIFAERSDCDCPESSSQFSISPRPPSGPARSGSAFRRQKSTAEKVANVAARRQEIEEKHAQLMLIRSSTIDERLQTAVSRANSLKPDHVSVVMSQPLVVVMSNCVSTISLLFAQTSIGASWSKVVVTINSIQAFSFLILQSRLLKIQDRSRYALNVM